MKNSKIKEFNNIIKLLNKETKNIIKTKSVKKDFNKSNKNLFLTQLNNNLDLNSKINWKLIFWPETRKTKKKELQRKRLLEYKNNKI